MKRLIFTAIISLSIYSAFAQDSSDSTSSSRKDKGFRIYAGYGEEGKHHWSKDTTTYSDHAYPRASFGLTFSRFDLGLATLIDNGSFTLSPTNSFLRYRSWKTSNVGFDLVQMGVRFSPNFKIYLSGGFDWTLIRLRENITILPNQPVLTYRQDNIDYSKNRFSSSYLRIPLSFDFRTNEDFRGKQMHFVFGPDAGILLNGRVKQISHENGKQKIDDDYHFTHFRYGAFVRMGYGDMGIFAKYYFNDMFENSPAQQGLKNFSFGFTLGF
ncbi:MAG TPA: outer membrane beta-barrel protein [Mucilaginibacter sp.]|nr:outer membrane beta-barrel protein [Mucilaginibacter sp.]